MASPNKGHLVMSAVEASSFVRAMIHREASGPGDSDRAMRKLEAKYGIGFHTLDHLRKGKAKTCDVGLYARIKAAFIDHCGRQAERLLNEAKNAQMAERNEDVGSIIGEIEALRARLEIAKSKAKGGAPPK